MDPLPLFLDRIVQRSILRGIHIIHGTMATVPHCCHQNVSKTISFEEVGMGLTGRQYYRLSKFPQGWIDNLGDCKRRGQWHSNGFLSFFLLSYVHIVCRTAVPGGMHEKI